MIDWAEFKAAGLEFVIIKYTEGTYERDSQAPLNNKSAKSAAIKTHGYHYLKSNTEGGVRKEADFFAAYVKEYPVDGYLFIDVEDNSCKEGLTAVQLSENLNAFMDQLGKNGFSKFGVYADVNWFKDYISRSTLRKDALIWLAAYENSPDPPEECDIWQYSGTGKLAGYSGDLDMDTAYTDVMVCKTASPPDTNPAPSGNTYTVRSGDTLNKIAVKYKMTIQQLESLNPQIKNPDMINAGQIINLSPANPASSCNTYTVRSGDTMSKIAVKYKLTLQQLESLNPQIKNPDMISVGQIINVSPKK